MNHAPSRFARILIGLLSLPLVGSGAWAAQPLAPEQMITTADFDAPPTAASHAPPLDESKTFSLYGHWDTDWVNNLSGGIRRGNALDSVAVGGFTLKGDQLGLSNSRFNVSLMATRVGDANAQLIGTDTNPSNIEGNRNRLVLNTAFWQQQWLSAPHLGISTRLGLFALDSEFDSTDSAAQLLNSSFGLDPTITDNFAASTFPKNGTGFVTRIGSAADPDAARFALKVGVIQGDVDQQTHPFSQGVLNIAEGQWRPNQGTAIKLGGWQKRGNGQPNLRGGYLSAETPLSLQPHHHLSGFIRASFATGMDEQANGTNRYLGAGINWQAPFAHRPDDYLTLGAATLHLEHSGDHERLLEAAYIVQITPRIFLQPDVQYIQHNNQPDTWVAIVRLHLE